MKKSISIAALTIFIFFNFSCKSNQMADANSQNVPEVWENGLTNITGVISKVTPEKDGQTIVLTNNKGIEYTAVISIPNLGENAGQYRQFKVGENVGFRGNLVENQRMIVREVLEMR